MSAFVNIILSIWFAKIMGLGGIFLATIVARAISSGWTDPYIVYKYVFKSSVMDYVVRCVKMILRLSVCFVISYFISRYIIVSNLLTFILKAIVLLIISFSSYIVLSFKTKEFIGIKNAIVFLINKRRK